MFMTWSSKIYEGILHVLKQLNHSYDSHVLFSEWGGGQKFQCQALVL